MSGRYASVYNCVVIKESARVSVPHVCACVYVRKCVRTRSHTQRVTAIVAKFARCERTLTPFIDPGK
jgi:hypothetical protein